MNPSPSLVYVPPTRWSAARWSEGSEAAPADMPASKPPERVRPFDTKPEPLFKEPLTPLESLVGNDVYVVGTFDTKGAELSYIRDCIAAQGLRVRTVDLSTSGKPSSADVPPHLVAPYHKGGSSAVFDSDRGTAVRAMADAFENWIARQRGIGGIISAAGSGGTALATPAMRRLPIGLPKVMISTVASGEVGQYVGPSDIMMMYSVTDVQGLNKISRQVLANGANAMVGMVKRAAADKITRDKIPAKPGLGLTMFGVTTTAIQQVTAQLDDLYDCQVFHATGVGGRSMEKLADSGLLSAVMDLTTTEICDMMCGGVFAATEDRFGAIIRTRIPYVGSLGAMDMVNFGARNTVPEKYKDRVFVEHNPQVTLMRTTASENAKMGDWIASRLNEMTGPVRFLIPEGGVSALDAPGKAFHDPAADKALFDALTARFQEGGNRRLIRVSHHINDPAFARAAIEALEEINPMKRNTRYAAV